MRTYSYDLKLVMCSIHKTVSCIVSSNLLCAVYTKQYHVLFQVPWSNHIKIGFSAVAVGAVWLCAGSSVGAAWVQCGFSACGCSSQDVLQKFALHLGDNLRSNLVTAVSVHGP